MARHTAVLLLALVAFAGAANAARTLKQDDTDDAADGFVDPSDVAFTFSFRPKFNIEPGLGIAALVLNPELALSLTPLALTLEQALNGATTFSPGFTAATSESIALPASSLTLPANLGSGALLNGIGSGALLNTLG
ncbi:MAG: hypothetical protein J3K34DRAFT_461488 [Monoraphidium minutum]|nr:MAG: hypothetical protein J3K34DRAFT_461488 [Monoraphidium minutum]